MCRIYKRREGRDHDEEGRKNNMNERDKHT